MPPGTNPAEGVTPEARSAGLRALLAAGLGAALAFFLRETSAVFVPFTVALLLALAGFPLVEWLAVRRVPPAVSVLLIVVFIFILLSLAGLLLEQGIEGLMGHLPQLKTRAATLWTRMSGRLGITAQPLEDLGKEPSALRALVGMGGSTALSLITGTFQLLLVILYLVFLLLGRRHLPNLLRRALGWDRARTVQESIQKIERQMLRYLVLRSAISVVTASAVGLILRLYGVPFAGLWALLTFFAQFIPFVGPILLSVLPVLFAALQNPSLEPACWIAGWLLLLHLVIGFVVEPKVFSIGLALNQTLVLLGLGLFGWMWGILGALLWVPIMVALRLTAQELPGFHAVDVFLGRADGHEGAPG
ncbi:MAG TPA: AI-2E family transporter [Planctomycetota bacterium]|nr:AI-2E family transporter [Planctomycetota bacterium]